MTTKKKTAINYLKDKEWSMGNGQCPECCGVPESWHGHPCHLDAATIGHEKHCVLAAALRDMGVITLMKGEFTGPNYETYWTKNGCLSTRIAEESKK